MTDKLPYVSVIMPVRNEEAFIGRSLEAVAAQNYPKDRIQLIVADGMSTDSTREIVQSFRNRFDETILIDNPGQIVPVGMNAALKKAKGEIIVRVDGHCEIAPDYISRCVAHILDGAVDGVGGPLDTIGENRTAQVIATAMSSPFGVGGSSFRTVTDKTMLTDTVAFPAYTRSAIDRAGPYDEELVRNQDDEYNYRLRKLGAKILLASDVRAKYYSRGSLRSLWRQYYQYGYWKVRVMQKHTKQMQPRQFVPALFVLSLSLCLLLSPFFRPALWLFVAGLGMYVGVNMIASIFTLRRSGMTATDTTARFFLITRAFAILHFSYGIGFLKGLVIFWNRWGDKSTRVSPPGVSVDEKRLDYV
jgi:succinoglycan biosynthesis protein ExoA